MSMAIGMTDDRSSLFVRFPDLDVDDAGKLGSLKLGYCYMPPRPIDEADGTDATLQGVVARQEVDTLRLANISGEDIVITASANLKKQCVVYQDRDFLKEAENVDFKSGSTMVLYIRLRPVLRREAFTTGEVRHIN